MKTIGWIGLGNMGIPMVNNLLNNNYNVLFFNRNQTSKAIIEEKGATGINDLDNIISQSDVIFLTLPNDDIVKDTFDRIHTTIKDKIFINSSTISPSLAEKLAMSIKDKGGYYLDAPVSGSVKPAVDGTLLFLVGGDKSVYERAIPYFEVMGKSHYYLGESGSGSKAKLAINYYMSVVVQGLAETVLFAEQNGINREMMTAIVNDSACGSGMSKIKTSAILSDDYPAAFPLKFMLKDIRLAQEAGWDTALTQAAEQAYAKASEQGLAEQDLMAVIKAIQ
ncbi:NAD(P)-dependent oxidoreductase [Myroides odoratimimus]|uniref:NAD(P)-dependent oxidoreductase n=1 Tax=Myroides odoratimimus TaxID=76832 RepID=UPI0025750DAB|nr:NAD(P)-dependent oxidoreductase [Myroides odoratimimus]MDM1451172.1 NAD(P)-dependent oxidoreductase [Myroides odoratimimus]MDM1529943.1 NAD(P)-dependent oxidoreductase [Myroides odoratimimus]